MLTIKSPSHVFSFWPDASFLIPSDTNTIIVTVINPIDDTINDYVFEQVKVTTLNSDTIVLSDKDAHESGVFALISFIYGQGDPSFMDIFNKYDGKVIAYNNEKLLMSPRSQLKGKSIPLTYIVTGYNEKIATNEDNVTNQDHPL
jgi:hypothetical protein